MMLKNIQTWMIKFPITTYPQPEKCLVLSAKEERTATLIYSCP